MAEYYPLLSRAVAGLRDSAPEARQAIYGRARQALIGQLRGMQPPVPEEAINKEITALDNAIARIETEMAPPPSISDAASAAVEAALLFEAAPEPASAFPPSAEITVPRDSATPEASRVAVKPPASRPAPPPLSRPADRPGLTPRASLPGGGRLQRQEPPQLDPVEPKPSLDDQAAAKPQPVTPAVEPILPVAPTLETVLVKRDEGPSPGATPAVDRDGEPTLDTTMAAEARTRDEIMRPAMPRQTVPQTRNLRVWIVAFAALAAVVVIALTAWKLRDNPQELVRAPTPATQTEAAPGKIVERADGAASTGDDAADTPAQGSTPGQGNAASSPQAATPVPTPSAGTAAQPASDQTVPVSYKAAVLVAAPDTPEKVKTYVGSVVWRLEGGIGQGASATSAVRADVDIPEAKLQMTMEIRKNNEAQFPASHTIDIKFTPGPDSLIGAVKQIDVPQMRREDAETGEPLIGVPVTITNNSFLVGLTRGDAEARNIEAMRSRGWFDIPMVLADGKPAKITFEKGASGDRILAEALAAWSKN